MQRMHDTTQFGDEILQLDPIDDYEVFCTNCDWFGMKLDCRYGLCPNCLNRVSRKKEEKCKS